MTNDTDSTATAKAKPRRAYKISVERIKILGVLCLFIVLIVILCMSALFDIETILIKGNNQISSEEIMSVASLKRGDNIFSIDVEDICKAVEALDRVDKCSIERSLPDKVSIYVYEKSELSYIKQKKGYVGIDETGRVMVQTNDTEKKVPVVSGIKIAEAKKGDYIKCEDGNAKKKIDVLLTILSELNSQGLIDDVKTINIKDTESVSMMLVTDTLVYLGGEGKEANQKFGFKIAYLKSILDEDYPKHGGKINISDTNMVTSQAS